MHNFPTVTYVTCHRTATRAIVSHLVHEGCWFEVNPLEEQRQWEISVKDDARAASYFPDGAELRRTPARGRAVKSAAQG